MYVPEALFTVSVFAPSVTWPLVVVDESDAIVVPPFVRPEMSNAPSTSSPEEDAMLPPIVRARVAPASTLVAPV